MRTMRKGGEMLKMVIPIGCYLLVAALGLI
jgi:hypothetical protein